MAATNFRLYVSYSQLAIFASSLEKPFNDWTERHLAQGFAWRPGSVSFRTLVESGAHSIDVATTKQLGAVSVNAIRAIDVPFEVPPDGAIEVASISDSVPITLIPGCYSARCEFLGVGPEGHEQVRITFAKDEKPHFAIARVDSQLSADKELLTTAEPAIS